MGVMEGLRHLAEDAECIRQRKTRLDGEAVGERALGMERHHVVQHRLAETRIDQRYDVGVSKVRQPVDFVTKPLLTDAVGQLQPQDLDRDRAIMLQVEATVDGGHAAGAELFYDPVAPGERAGELARNNGHVLFLLGWRKPSTRPRGKLSGQMSICGRALPLLVRSFLALSLGLAFPRGAHAQPGLPRKSLPESVRLHLASWHDRAGYNNANYGLALRWSNGLVIGGFNNSLARPSWYGGLVVPVHEKRFQVELMAGVITGYSETSPIDVVAVPSLGWRLSPRSSLQVILIPHVVIPANAVHVMFERRFGDPQPTTTARTVTDRPARIRRTR